MNVLIVEDDDAKASDLVTFLSAHFKVDLAELSKSFQSGLRQALRGRFDVILLDMTMRNFDRTLDESGGRPHHFAGREILRQMQREGIRTPVIVVTQLDRFGDEPDEMTVEELTDELKLRFANYVGTVNYRANVDEWKAQLLSSMRQAVRERET